MTKTLKQTVYEMLTENTGKAICDSGGDSGRHWQQNAGKTLQDFEREPVISHDFDYADFIQRQKNAIEKGWTKDKTIREPESDDIMFTLSVFHVLTENAGLTLDELCDTFNSKFVPAKNWNATDTHGVSLSGEIWLKDHGFTFKDGWNTYNGDSSLSQTLQGTMLEHENGDTYALIQAHGGADVRGGYTDARLFKCEDSYLNLNPTVYGDISGVPVISEDGVTTLQKESKETGMGDGVIPLTADSKIELYIS